MVLEFYVDEDGMKAWGWLLWLEQHFQANQIPEADMLKEAVKGLRGCALNWYKRWSVLSPYLSWRSFDRAFIGRYIPEIYLVEKDELSNNPEKKEEKEKKDAEKEKEIEDEKEKKPEQDGKKREDVVAEERVSKCVNGRGYEVGTHATIVRARLTANGGGCCDSCFRQLAQDEDKAEGGGKRDVDAETEIKEEEEEKKNKEDDEKEVPKMVEKMMGQLGVRSGLMNGLNTCIALNNMATTVGEWPNTNSNGGFNGPRLTDACSLAQHGVNDQNLGQYNIMGLTNHLGHPNLGGEREADEAIKEVAKEEYAREARGKNEDAVAKGAEEGEEKVEGVEQDEEENEGKKEKEIGVEEGNEEREIEDVDEDEDEVVEEEKKKETMQKGKTKKKEKKGD